MVNGRRGPEDGVSKAERVKALAAELKRKKGKDFQDLGYLFANGIPLEEALRLIELTSQEPSLEQVVTGTEAA